VKDIANRGLRSWVQIRCTSAQGAAEFAIEIGAGRPTLRDAGAADSAVRLAAIDYRFTGEEDAPEADGKSKGGLMFSIARIGVDTLMVPFGARRIYFGAWRPRSCSVERTDGLVDEAG
jgi:hypothetical protein